MEDEGAVCDVCGEHVHNLEHKNSVNHRFHFRKWEYNNYRKALIKDRHGVTLNVEPEAINNFRFNFDYVKSRGKYKIKVSPEQLRLHRSTITFKCTIKSNRRDPIYITSTYLLHPSHYFRTMHDKDFGEDTFFLLLPGASYDFKVVFETNVLQCASFKIPLCCDFQTVDINNVNEERPHACFTLTRSFLTIIDDQTEEKKEKTKSPFTCVSWKDVTKTIPTMKHAYYTDRYMIPGKYLKLLSHGIERFDGMNSHEEDSFRELSQLLRSLTPGNYNHFWHIVLWLEERAQSLMLMNYNMEKVTMEIKGDDILIIEVPGLAEKRPSVIVGDYIRIRITGDHVAYKGFVCEVNEKTVEISHIDDELIEYITADPTTQVDVAFMLSRLSFERMHQAVDTLVATGMVARLFPSTRQTVRNRVIHQLNDSDIFNETICDNPEQKNAVNKILNTVHDLPYIVFGPPGTGKTITIVEAILQIKKRTKKTILVCAPANSACDMLAIKLMAHCKTNELIRIHSTTRERTTITPELMEYSNMEDDEFTKVDIAKLKSYRIVVTTLTLIGRFAKDYRPDCVFVDEAAQASEPETDIAVALAGAGKQVVLAGDPKQLGPIATKRAEHFGLGISLLERLMGYEAYKPNARTKNYDTNFITMLKLNFRSHPDILLIPNQLFYDNLLKPMSLDAQRDPLVDIAIYPIIKKSDSLNSTGRAVEFYSVSSKEQREGSSPSFFNLFEAKMVVRYVKTLCNLPLPSAYKVRLDQIGVVTPYKRQVHKIKAGLTYNGYDGVEVGTTESFQGREKRIIILSTVRAQHSLLLHDKKYNLGFVKHDQRFNVAVTRAISKLIVIGCPLVLTTDEKWRMHMELCQDYHTYFGNCFASTSSTFREDVLERTRRFKPIDDQYVHL